MNCAALLQEVHIRSQPLSPVCKLYMRSIVPKAYLVVEADNDIERNRPQQRRVHEVVVIHEPQSVHHNVQVSLPEGDFLHRSHIRSATTQQLGCTAVNTIFMRHVQCMQACLSLQDAPPEKHIPCLKSLFEILYT